jgi:hypothetical protein
MFTHDGISTGRHGGLILTMRTQPIRAGMSWD